MRNLRRIGSNPASHSSVANYFYFWQHLLYTN
jgi:hypothetical protein